MSADRATPTKEQGGTRLWFITPQARARLSAIPECLGPMRVAVTLIPLGVRSVLVLVHSHNHTILPKIAVWLADNRCSQFVLSF